MPSFGPTSRANLDQCDIRLQRLFEEVVKDFDCSVLVGHRGKEAQEAAYRAGNSRARYGESYHNYEPSYAVDVAPYPIDWNNIDRFRALAAVVKSKAAELNIPIVWGGDWVSLKDYDHFQLADTTHAKLP